MGNGRTSSARQPRAGVLPGLVFGTLATLLLSFAGVVTPLVMGGAPAHAAPARPAIVCKTTCIGEVKFDYNSAYPTYQMDGALSLMNQGTLTGTGANAIRNEVRVTDYSYVCGALSPEFSAGYSTRTDNLQTWYFWEECRPNVDTAPITHWQYQVPSNNYGVSWYYELYQYNSTTWKIDFFNSSWHWYWGGTSSNNYMSDYDTYMGINTSGPSASGMGANTTYFSGNEYKDGNGVWQYFNWNGDAFYDTYPPSFTWSTPPSQSSSGGVGYTCWC